MAIPHLLSCDQFTREQVDQHLNTADLIGHDPDVPPGGTRVGLLFFEPSTRTRLSFETAAIRLGYRTLILLGSEATSLAKGESIEDTVRVAGQFAHLLVLRHPSRRAIFQAAEKSRCPVVNAGNGDGEHPTQALGDLLTIRRKVGRLDGIHVAMTGDLLYSRTVHSLIKMLNLYRGVHLHLVPLRGCEVDPRNIISGRFRFDGYSTYPSVRVMIDQVGPTLNVAYATRLQTERWPPGIAADPAVPDRSNYPLCMWTKGLAEDLPENCIILDPLPRVQEMDVAVDDNPRALYLTAQIESGIHVRMAVLKMLLNKV
jgi:aspartate carbamoyltransferase catalytic subunit